MTLDWITVAAQLVNFLVLVWLLKRFLYRPVLDGIDAREAEIAARMAEARQIRETAEAARAEHRAETERLRAARDDALEHARAEAAAERDTLLAQARARLVREREARAAERAEEARAYTEGLQQTGATALLALTRKALHDLSDETLEDRIASRAAFRLAEMTDDLKDAAGDSRAAVVTSREEMSKDQRRRIEATIEDALPGTRVRFVTDPAQSPGLSLRVGGAQLGWSVDDYVHSLQDMLDDAIHARERRDAA